MKLKDIIDQKIKKTDSEMNGFRKGLKKDKWKELTEKRKKLVEIRDDISTKNGSGLIEVLERRYVELANIGIEERKEFANGLMGYGSSYTTSFRNLIKKLTEENPAVAYEFITLDNSLKFIKDYVEDLDQDAFKPVLKKAIIDKNYEIIDKWELIEPEHSEPWQIGDATEYLAKELNQEEKEIFDEVVPPYLFFKDFTQFRALNNDPILTLYHLAPLIGNIKERKKHDHNFETNKGMSKYSCEVEFRCSNEEYPLKVIRELGKDDFEWLTDNFLRIDNGAMLASGKNLKIGGEILPGSCFHIYQSMRTADKNK